MIPRHFLYATVLAIASLACSSSFAAEPSSVALAMVKKLRLGDNLPSMGYQAATTTQTYRIIVQSVGPEKARTLITDELNRARPKYQDRWDKNLAASYSESFSEEELQSIADKQKASPYINKFLAKQGEVGNNMQAKSTELLDSFVTEVVSGAFNKVVPKKVTEKSLHFARVTPNRSSGLALGWPLMSNVGGN